MIDGYIHQVMSLLFAGYKPNRNDSHIMGDSSLMSPYDY